MNYCWVCGEKMTTSGNNCNELIMTLQVDYYYEAIQNYNNKVIAKGSMLGPCEKCSPDQLLH